jgi:hypothetical protein
MAEQSRDGGGRQLTEAQIEEIRQGRMLLHTFFSVLKTAAYHQAGNVALEEPSEQFADILRWFLEREAGPLKLEIAEGQMFAGTSRVRPSKRQQPAVSALSKFFRRRGIGGLIIAKPLETEEVSALFTVVVEFKKPIGAKNGVDSLVEALQEAGFAHLVTPTPPVQVRLQGAMRKVKALGEVGQLAVQLSKGLAMVKASQQGASDVAKAGTRHVVREVSDLEPEVRDKVVGLAMVAATDDMAMRSLTILLVGMSIADALKMPRALRADLGQACIDLATYDDEIRQGVNKVSRELQGAVALRWLADQPGWNISSMRQGLSIAGRYMKPRSFEGRVGSPRASRLAEVIRAACDYVDLTTPTPMKDTDPFLKDSPLAPHEALRLMRGKVGDRYGGEVVAALLDGIGMLPVGTPVEMADGLSAVVISRTDDPLKFNVQDTLSRREREATLRPGPNQISRVVTGGDLLKVRSKFMLGDDFEKIQDIAKDLHDSTSEE